MSTRAARRSGGGGVGHFAVGRRLRHVAQVAPAAVVDAAGCGCRPRRPRMTMALRLSLPSFLKPSSFSTASKPAAQRSAAASASSTTTSFFPSSSSAASFSSSSSSGAAASKHHQQQLGLNNWPPPSSPAPASVTRKKKKKKTREQQSQRSYYYQVEEKKKKKGAMEGTEEEVGVAVEKESSDPRGDFRESMTRMVVETGLCGWDDLRCMLRRLLALNAPRHHAAILTAFAELCAQLAAPPASSSSPPPVSYHCQYQY